MTDGERNKLIDQHVDALMEHFSTVNILVTYPCEDGNGTMGVARGAGDFYARFGMAMEFIDRAKADTLAEKINPQV